MGYSEIQCHLCGVSFNIIFRLRSGELDVPEYDERPIEETGSANCTDRDETAQDPDYIPQEESENNQPYEYNSDHDSIDGMTPDRGDTHDIEQSSIDAKEGEEMEWYSDWISEAYDPRRGGCEGHVGYYDSPMSGYSVDAISPEEAKGCRTAQFLMHKDTLRDQWQADALHEPWEIDGDWTLSGICDGIPSRDMSSPEVMPARNGADTVATDNVNFLGQDRTPDSLAMPFHPWCFDIFCRQSKIRFQRVNISGLMTWRNAEFDWDGFWSFPRAQDVERAREQWWHHESGSEYLVANPIYVPGLPAILLGTIKDDERSFQSGMNRYTSSHTIKLDLLSSLPREVRLMIIDHLSSSDIAHLSLASRTFTDLPNSVWYKLVRKEMPWLWEAWEESECTHAPLVWTKVSTAEVKFIFNARNHYSRILVEDSYMVRSDAEKAAASGYPLPMEMPEVKQLSRVDTNWRRVFTQIRLDWDKLKGLQNRRRIWTDVEEIVRRIRKFDR